VSSLRPISAAAIPRALEKAERYRLLNEPAQAESICRDILAVDAAHQGALVTLVLSLADEIDASPDGARAIDELLPRLTNEYERVYYRGIARERWARSLVKRGDISGQALGWLHEAMSCYERASSLPHAENNDDAILRFNACVRLIERARLEAPADAIDPGDAVPLRR
jgi:hypothetical protein